MKKIALFTLLTFLAAPIALAETQLDFLMEDIKVLEQHIQEDGTSETHVESESAYQQQTSLFPADDAAPTQTTGDASLFVSFTIEGGSVVVFDDVPLDAWFATFVRSMAQSGIIAGYRDATGVLLGKFGPADSVTIEQLAKISVEAAGVDQSKCPEIPKNKEATARWSSTYISCAEFLGWSVYSDATVDPYRNANRAEVVTTVLQAFNRQFEIASGDVFKDVTSTMAARYAIETAALDGIVAGYTNADGSATGYFGPFDNVNRAETAKIVSLALSKYKK